jgi:signal transduction histidine kinase
VRGTGLGLFICRQIVRAHGGEIKAESTQGKGTTFHINLPLERAQIEENLSLRENVL